MEAMKTSEAVEESEETIYKKIKIHCSHQLDPNAIAQFNQSFAVSEVQLELNGQVLTILLRELDFNELENITKQLSKSTQQPIFIEILEKIDSVKSYGINGKKRNYVDYNQERKVKNRKEKAANRKKYYYAANHHFQTENQKIDDHLINQIIQGDSEILLKKIPDNSVDLILTSPPYNFGLDYEKNEDDFYWEDYFKKLFSVFQECIRILKYGGRMIVNVQPLFSDYIPSHHIISNFFIQQKLIWKGEILWEKNNYNCKYTAWGSWKSPSNPYLKYTWEFIEIFCKGDLKKSGNRDDMTISAEEFKKWVVAKWSIAPERKMKDYGHPAMFPEELVERILKLFSYQNDVILDPFNGVGTTTAVANQLDRNYIGIDVSEDYCEKAKERIKEQSKQMRLFNEEFETKN